MSLSVSFSFTLPTEHENHGAHSKIVFSLVRFPTFRIFPKFYEGE